MFGQPVYEKGEVELAVRRAQKAVLNPSSDLQGYWEHDFNASGVEVEDELKFTKNLVGVLHVCPPLLWRAGGCMRACMHVQHRAQTMSLPCTSKGCSPFGTLCYSRQQVVMEIQGAPGNLTLIDLPGIIRFTDNGDAHYVSHPGLP